jgi:hypothetical protein
MNSVQAPPPAPPQWGGALKKKETKMQISAKPKSAFLFLSNGNGTPLAVERSHAYGKIGRSHLYGKVP